MQSWCSIKKIPQACKRLALTVVALSFLSVASHSAIAARLSTEGAIYSIAEPDLLQQIYQMLGEKAASGELEKLQKKLVNHSVAHILRPAPVSGVTDLPAGQDPKVTAFDPTVLVDHDVTLMRQGHPVVLAAKGQKINPLDQFIFREKLLFINGDNSQQIDWLKQQLHLIKQPAAQAVAKPQDLQSHALVKSARLATSSQLKIILVNGNIKTVSQALHHRVYFDQSGALCQRFHIQHTPAEVFQAKQQHYLPYLVVEEVSVESSN